MVVVVVTEPVTKEMCVSLLGKTIIIVLIREYNASEFGGLTAPK